MTNPSGTERAVAGLGSLELAMNASLVTILAVAAGAPTPQQVSRAWPGLLALSCRVELSLSLLG